MTETTPVTDEDVQAALTAAIAWQKEARQPLWTAPATEQVRAMLEAVAPSEPRDITAAVFACREEDTPIPFALYREQDVTGVSGEGTVAHGVKFADGTVVIRWVGRSPSTVIWESLDAALAVHGHDGRTRVVWLAAPFSEMALAEQEATAAEFARIRQLAERCEAVGTSPGGRNTYFTRIMAEEASDVR